MKDIMKFDVYGEGDIKVHYFPVVNSTNLDGFIDWFNSHNKINRVTKVNGEYQIQRALFTDCEFDVNDVVWGHNKDSSLYVDDKLVQLTFHNDGKSDVYKMKL